MWAPFLRADVSIRSICRDVGRILQALAGVTLAAAVVPALWGEFYAVPAFLVAAGVAGVAGTLAARRCADAPDPGRLHGMMTAALGWLLVAVFGALPFLGVAWTVELGLFGAPALEGRAADTLAVFRSPLNAFFESASGFTGTGLTMTDSEPALPRGLQWWRSTTEYVGGVGVIVLTTAVLARPGSGSLTLYESEARSEKIHPSVVSTVRTIWWIFLLFTFLSVAVLFLAGMPPWEALNHGMTGLATGGFSVTDQSIAAYGPLVQYAMVPVMVLGSIAFPVHYLVLRGDLRSLYTDLQTRWLWGFLATGSVLLVGSLLAADSFTSTEAAVRAGVFQFVSAASCTGFGSVAGDQGIGTWPAGAQLTMTVGMVVGAAAGSTVGGIKLVRAATLVKGARFRIAGVFYPSTAVRRFELDGRVLDSEEAAREFQEAAIVAVLWVVFLALALAGTLALLPVGAGEAYSLENAVFEVASAQGNVGLSTGITGPGMPAPLKLLYCFSMWIGRLEIIPVLVLLRGALDGLGVYQ